MNWTAIVPMKQGEASKSRLAPQLSPAQRLALNDAMTAHVLNCLMRVPEIVRIVVLSPEPIAQPNIEWARDEGRGINVELAMLRRGISPLLIVHGDLPLLQATDIETLLHAAETHGISIAPDRHGLGTNALALADDRPFDFGFGPGSFAGHVRGAGSRIATVACIGLSHDVDTLQDLELISAMEAHSTISSTWLALARRGRCAPSAA
jgi:2-phospho-L-lactate guanylyltransferase